MDSLAIEKKRQDEQRVMDRMIRIYCRGKHHQKKELCEECSRLKEYADYRTQKCPFMETKTFCSACKVHCYTPQMREKVRQVMKYSGPRMLLYHPPMAIKHVAVTLSAKRKERKKANVS